MRLKLIAVAAAAAAVLGATAAQGTVVSTFLKRLKISAPISDATLTGTGPVALTGLTAAQKELFLEGGGEFQAVETPEGGLGPIFNGASCVECHTAGGIGGASAIAVTRFGRTVNGQFDDMAALGGSLLQSKAIHPAVQEVVPTAATIVAKRITTPLFGAGLIEAIPDATLQISALIPRGDGISGRAALVHDVVSGKQRVGRFGWKAQQATLLAFSGDAYVNEMGVTSRFFPTEEAPNGNTALLAQYDTVPDVEDTIDPETGRSDIDNAANFMRFLAPLPQLRASASSLAGGVVFAAINCTGCHTPVLFTGANAVSALSFKPVPLYSDLLLHDMGAGGDGIAQGAAKPNELRTAPLWGLRARTAFMHDGRAPTVDAAIRAHAGEATASRNRYVALPAAKRQQLLDFLSKN